MKYTGFLLLVFMLLIPVSTFAQEPLDPDTPSWLILEFGKQAYSRKDFGTAMWYFREILRREGAYYPEAHIWISKIYKNADMEYNLARKHLEMAYENRDQLYILDEQFEILYELAELEWGENNKKKFEEYLLTILNDDQEFRSADMDAMRKVLHDRGFNDVVRLFRYSSDFSLSAHQDLGYLYVAAGRNMHATDNLLYAVLTVLTKCIEEVRRYYPDYAYETLEEFITRTEEFPALRTYLENVQIYRTLFYLGASLDVAGYGADGRYLWRTVLQFSGDDKWKVMARKSLSGS